MSRRGAVLLEVLAALTIFAIAAIAAVDLLVQLSATEHWAATAERVVADQERLLTAMSLLSRDDLDRRLGAREVGPYLVTVRRPEPMLYRVEVGDSAGPALATLVYRPGTPNHAP